LPNKNKLNLLQRSRSLNSGKVFVFLIIILTLFQFQNIQTKGCRQIRLPRQTSTWLNLHFYLSCRFITRANMPGCAFGRHCSLLWVIWKPSHLGAVWQKVSFANSSPGSVSVANAEFDACLPVHYSMLMRLILPCNDFCSFLISKLCWTKLIDRFMSGPTYSSSLTFEQSDKRLIYRFMSGPTPAHSLTNMTRGLFLAVYDMMFINI
jgi:hypothetical protein